jgi:S-adenosylmethionine-diacylglycerol 3-amino-3-carboxypropyl transferase
MKVLYGRAMPALFKAETIEEQRAIYRQRIDGRRWRFMIREGFSERTLKMVLNDAGYRVTIDVDSVGDYVLDRVDRTFMNHLARDNHWVSFMFTGKYPDRETLPHYLLRSNYDAIRVADTDVQIVTDDLVEFMQQIPDHSFDKFSLSDVTSCIDREQFAMLMKHVARVARPAGRVCYRNFLAKYQVPDEWQLKLRRDEVLNSSLTWDDKAFVYDFEVLSVSA